MTKSTHVVEVVPINLRSHPNADSLSIVDVFDGGFTVCVRTQDWVGKSLGAFIPPDSLVNTDRPEFSFLRKDGTSNITRIKACKLRGITSFGLLVPAPDGAKIGDDVAQRLGVTHYEPQAIGETTGGEAEKVPVELHNLSKYDVDSLRKYHEVFTTGEPIYCSEKIHGSSSRYAYIEDRMYCGSRGEWKAENAGNLWWKCLQVTPEIEDFCKANPGYILYGEVYGNVQDLKYGCGKGEVRFAAFDILSPDRRWLNPGDFRDMAAKFGVPVVPLIGFMPYDFEEICGYAEGRTMVEGANHVREGCVVKPIQERWDDRVGRVCLKVVGAGYLEKSK